MEFGGLILAAGMSSRIGAFKNLLALRGIAVIENTLQSLLSVGIEDVCVVSGKNHEDVEAIIEKYDVEVVRNEKFDYTDMVESIKLGLFKLLDKDAIVFLPSDCPVVESETIKKMMNYFEKSTAEILVPIYRGENGYPLIISKNCYNKLLNFRGERGLKEILFSSDFKNVFLKSDDYGIIKDMEFIEDYIIS